ncbi:hypothetical protein HYX14_06340 [Candidatus Woesearchaeota archaeon]|nr:hypothetical protein [Candidatus Woesearchaeota archaeon]
MEDSSLESLARDLLHKFDRCGISIIPHGGNYWVKLGRNPEGNISSLEVCPGKGPMSIAVVENVTGYYKALPSGYGWTGRLKGAKEVRGMEVLYQRT